MTLTKEQLHDLRSALGVILMAVDVLDIMNDPRLTISCGSTLGQSGGGSSKQIWAEKISKNAEKCLEILKEAE